MVVFFFFRKACFFKRKGSCCADSVRKLANDEQLLMGDLQ